MMKELTGKHPGRFCATILLACGMSLTGCSSGTQTTRPMEDEPGYGGRPSEITDPGKVGSLAEKWGVEVLGIQTTATGYMLDFRYRVLDAQKAASLLDRRIKPYIIVEKDNAKLRVPVSSKLGALRQTTLDVKADRNYFVLFGNPGRHVLSGDRVTVVIGDFVVEHLTVL